MRLLLIHEVMKMSKKITLIVFVSTTVLLTMLSGCSTGLSCEQQLNYCQNTLKETTKDTYFTNQSTQDDIVRWWKKGWFHGRALGLIKVDYRLEDLTPFSKQGGYETYILPGDKGISIFLKIPTVKADEEYTQCLKKKAILKASANEPGLKIDLNPYCSESYGANEVDFSLYWVSLKEKPIVELVTNGPACVPASLYVYDKTKKSYMPAAEKCGG